LICVLLAACGTSPIAPSGKHITQPNPAQSHGSADIPQANTRTLPLPPPKPTAKIETYSVVVSNVPAQEILFALARDAKINLDISPGIVGNVSINAVNQTLPQILDRVSKQVDMRYELDNGTLLVMPDKPFLKTYKIDFINMSRKATSTNATSTQIGGSAASSGAAGGNTGSTTVTSATENDLMKSLIQNVTDILLEEDRLRYKSLREKTSASQVVAQGEGAAAAFTGSPAGKGKQAGGDSGPAGGASGAGNETVQATGAAKSAVAEFEKSVSVFANKETGVLVVRATSRQHEKVQEFIDRVMLSAKRQVLIEATIVEVKLNDQYKQGIDWTAFGIGAEGFIASQTALSGIKGVSGALTIASINKVVGSITLLEKFGNVKVLSSPKLSVMNNQTASLKVADSKVYFTVIVTPATFGAAAGGGTSVLSPATYTTTPNSVSIGLTMSVTPQINDNDTVTINVRPSVSRILSYAKDPNPTLANPCGNNIVAASLTDSCKSIENLIPEIQTREMESIIKVESGQTAVMGGLIQESIDKKSDEVPFLARIPLLGQIFQNRDDTTTKTELVIFLRPVVIKDASLDGDFKGFANNLPNARFFHEDARGDYSKP
jgi:general secretion pathway protein D